MLFNLLDNPPLLVLLKFQGIKEPHSHEFLGNLGNLKMMKLSVTQFGHQFEPLFLT